MTLTPEKLASLRAAAARAADGWSPTSSSWAALEHCAEASPVAVMALCDEVTATRVEATPGAAYKAFAALLRATYLDELPSAETCDDWRGMAANGRAEVDAMRIGLRKLEAERDGMAKALELARAEVAKLRGQLERADALYGSLESVMESVREEIIILDGQEMTQFRRENPDEAGRVLDSFVEKLVSLLSEETLP